MPKKESSSAERGPSFQATAHNYLSDLTELSLHVPQGATPESFELVAETRFGTATIYLDDYERMVEFALTKADLRLATEGCAIAPGHRLGETDPVKPKVRVSQNETKTRKSGRSLGIDISARAGAGGVRASAGGNLSASTNSAIEKKDNISKEYKFEEVPIIALAGNRWQFSAVGADYLKSRYSGDQTLCTIDTKDKNARLIARLSFTPMYICILDVTSSGNRLTEVFRASPTKTALAKVLLAKHLREPNTAPDSTGSINASVAEIRLVEPNE